MGDYLAFGQRATMAWRRGIGLIYGQKVGFWLRSVSDGGETLRKTAVRLIVSIGGGLVLAGRVRCFSLVALQRSAVPDVIVERCYSC